jgi:uncharacterized protein YndB with AHSA1/START domain
MQAISVEARSNAAPDRVWELLADTASWARWAPFDEAGLESKGSPEREGVGAVRRFRHGRRVTRERVVAFEPPRRFRYELVSGLPIRDYRADVTLAADDGGTLISWESRFRGKFPVPAALVKPTLERFVRDTAEGLARAAEPSS